MSFLGFRFWGSALALGTPVLLAHNFTGTSSQVSDAFTPEAEEWMLAFVHVSRGGANSAQSTVTDSEGGTWTFVGGLVEFNTNSARFDIHRRLSSASPASMTVTAASAFAARMTLGIVQIANASTDFSNFKFDGDPAGDPAPTLDATQAASSVTFAGITTRDNGVPTMPAGYTALYSNNNTVNHRAALSYLAGTTTPGVTFTSANTDAVGGLLEVKRG